MKRFLIVCIAALLAGPVALAAGSGGGTHAQLRAFVCQRALDPAARAVSIAALMRPLPGTAKMAMRFELLRRSSRHGRAVSVAGPGLRSWITPHSKAPVLGTRAGDRWIVKHPVVGLAAPAFYQFRVTFRWLDAAGRWLGRAVRVGRVCFQPELRPDLQIVAVNVTPLSGQPGEDAFVAEVRNAGRTASAPFDVQLSDGGTIRTESIPRLRAHDAVRVHFVAPACTTAMPANVTADPSGVIDEADRTNNSMTVACS